MLSSPTKAGLEESLSRSNMYIGDSKSVENDILLFTINVIELHLDELWIT